MASTTQVTPTIRRVSIAKRLVYAVLLTFFDICVCAVIINHLAVFTSFFSRLTITIGLFMLLFSLLQVWIEAVAGRN